MYFSFDSFWYLILLLFRIKSQLSVAYKSVVYKKAHSVVFEEMTLPHDFSLMFIQYFNVAILLEKYCIKRGGGREG